MSAPVGIDPRGPRFAATITSVLLLIATFLALTGVSTHRTEPAGDWAIVAASPLERLTDPGFLVALVIALLFLWSVVSPPTAPWGALFRSVVRPRLAPPSELEDPRPPRFAQGVGLVVVGAGLVLHLTGVPWALPVATAAAFVAAFLNAAFSFCLGCQLYLVLQRTGLLGRNTRPA